MPISVDLFDGQLVGRQPAMVNCSEKDIPGEAIDYDFTNDVGLIRIKPGRKLPASRVVPADWRPKKGMSMTTVGCSHGNDATAWSTKILDPRIGMSNTSTKESFATIKCMFQPKEGRSGGGLYTSDGYVAGVCDFADPNERVGLYAVPEAIHRLLDRNQLMALYKAPTQGGDVLLAANRTTKAKASTGTKVRAQNPDESANPEDVTLPPPSMVGIKNPPGDAKAWRSRAQRRHLAEEPAKAHSDQPRSPRPIRSTLESDPVRPWWTTDLSGDPGDEARALEDVEQRPAPAPAPKRPTSTDPHSDQAEDLGLEASSGGIRRSLVLRPRVERPSKSRLERLGPALAGPGS